MAVRSPCSATVSASIPVRFVMLRSSLRPLPLALPGALTLEQLTPPRDQLSERRELGQLPQELQHRLEVAVADQHASQLEHLVARRLDALLDAAALRRQLEHDAAAVVLGRRARDEPRLHEPVDEAARVARLGYEQL